MTSFCRMFMVLFTMAITSATTAPFAANTQGSDFSQYQAKYDLVWYGLRVGKSTHTIRKVGDNQYKVDAHSVPIIPVPLEDYESSEFVTTESLVQPKHYKFKTHDKRKELIGSFTFDWKTSNVEKKIEGEEKPSVFMVPPQTQDKITHFFQLRRDLKLKKNLNYTVLEPKGIKPYTYKIVAKENLKTPIGTLKTLVLEHVSANKKRTTRVWVAEDMDYVMVKLMQIKGGKVIAEATIEKYDLL